MVAADVHCGLLADATSDVLALPLEWREPTDHPQDLDGSCILLADGIGGKYHIGPEETIRRDGSRGHLLWWAHDNFIGEPCASIDEAKAKAEADWQRRFAARAATPTAGRLDRSGAGQ